MKLAQVVSKGASVCSSASNHTVLCTKLSINLLLWISVIWTHLKSSESFAPSIQRTACTSTTALLH